MLQDQAQVVNILDILHCDRGDQVAKTRDGLHVAFLLQPFQRFADGGDAKCIAPDQLGLGDAAAGIELAGEDVVFYGDIHLVGERGGSGHGDILRLNCTDIVLIYQ